jgi:hypothetical protein
MDPLATACSRSKHASHGRSNPGGADLDLQSAPGFSFGSRPAPRTPPRQRRLEAAPASQAHSLRGGSQEPLDPDRTSCELRISHSPALSRGAFTGSLKQARSSRPEPWHGKAASAGGVARCGTKDLVGRKPDDSGECRCPDHDQILELVSQLDMGGVRRQGRRRPMGAHCVRGSRHPQRARAPVRRCPDRLGGRRRPPWARPWDSHRNEASPEIRDGRRASSWLDRTRLSIEDEVTFKGLAKLAAPLAVRDIRRRWQRSLERLREAAEAEATPGPGGK